MFARKNKTIEESHYDGIMREKCNQLLIYSSSMSELYAEIQESKLVADCFPSDTPNKLKELQHIENLRHSMRCAAGAYDATVTGMRQIQAEHAAELSTEWSTYKTDKDCHECLHNIVKNYK